MEAVTLHIPVDYPMTDDELFAFCAANKELRIERDEYGQLIVMSPAGGITGNINFKLTAIFGEWVQQNEQLGYGFDSATGFRLRDTSMRSPDVSCVAREKWEALSLEEQEKFAPVCPDFVIELRSKSDSLPALKNKMTKWIDNGCRLAWLIDPIEKKAWIYKPANATREVSTFDSVLSGEDVLPGFILQLSRLR